MSTSGPADPTRPTPPFTPPATPLLPPSATPSAADTPPQEPPAAAPWSPYPIQDWQQVSPSPDWVDPSWAPPPPGAAPGAPAARRRRRWVPYLVVALVTVLAAGGFFVADRVGERELGSRAQGYLPEDGFVQYTMRQTPDGGEVPYVTESARLTGVEEFTAADFTFSTALLTASGLDLDGLNGVPFWRTTSTRIGGEPESSQQLVRVYQVDGPIALLGESGPGVAHTYQPALVELPAGVRAGDSWTGAGSAGQALNYRSEFRAEAGDRGCLQVNGTVTYSRKDGARASADTIRKGWCPQEGIIQEVVTAGGSTVTESTLRGRPSIPAVKTVDEPVSWRDPRNWKNTQLTSVSIDQNFGEGIMTGSPSSVPPVITSTGLVVRATSSSDLVVFTPKTPTTWTSLWRMRPGGTLITLAAFGEVVVATTSLRQVVAYSASGVRLWQHDLDEVSFQAPVRIDDARIALVDDGGTVRVLDIAGGDVRWQRSLRAEVKVSPVADPRAVVVADGAGDFTAFDPDDGTELWQRELEVSRATVVGDTLVTSAAQTLTAVSITDGSIRWLQPLSGTVDVLQTFAGRAVLGTQLSTTVLSEAGAVEATFEPAVLLTPTADRLIAWGSQRAQVIDRSLAVVSTLDPPDRTLATAGGWPVADRFGVMLFAGDWSFETWSDQP